MATWLSERVRQRLQRQRLESHKNRSVISFTNVIGIDRRRHRRRNSCIRCRRRRRRRRTSILYDDKLLMTSADSSAAKWARSEKYTAAKSEAATVWARRVCMCGGVQVQCKCKQCKQCRQCELVGERRQAVQAARVWAQGERAMKKIPKWISKARSNALFRSLCATCNYACLCVYVWPSRQACRNEEVS